jgi:hypothetical protein
MGVTLDSLRFLLSAKESGVVFENLVSIGRQNLAMSHTELQYVLDHMDSDAIENIIDRYADKLFECLGAKSVQSLDYSAYEGATLIHDMNQPIGGELKERFDLVFDGGSLEHIFNFPISMKNCMEMVKIGGHLILHTPANNYFGHGLYQFSGELFYRVLSPENGFQVKRMIAAEDTSSGRWFEVFDSKTANSRIEVINALPVSLLVLAQRTQHCEIFAQLPQEHNYEVAWAKPRKVSQSSARNRNFIIVGAKQALMKVSPSILDSLRSTYSAYRKRRRELEKIKMKSFANQNYFRPIDKNHP